MKRKKLPKQPPLTKVERRAREYAKYHPFINEVWASEDCWHYLTFRLPPDLPKDYRPAGFATGTLQYCCECGTVFYPSFIRNDSVCYAIGAAL